MKNNKIVSLQVLRAVCFFMIFFFHAHIGNMGALAVSVFFVLSGFVMTYSYNNYKEKVTLKESILFSLNKIKKLYPLHIIMMLSILIFDLIVLLLKKEYINPFNWIIKLIFNITLSQSLIPNDKIIFSYNGVSWYLSASLFVYMFFPIIYNYLKKISNQNSYKFNIIITFIIQFLLAFAMSKINIKIPFTNRVDRWFTYIFPLFRVGDFFIGCNLGMLYKNYYKEITKSKAFFLEVITILAIVINQIIYSSRITFLGADSFRYTIISLPISISLVYLFAYNNGIFTKLLSNCSILIKIGNLSGYLFLIHQVVIRQIDTLLEFMPQVLSNKFIIIIIDLILSYLLTILYKKLQTRFLKI